MNDLYSMKVDIGPKNEIGSDHDYLLLDMYLADTESLQKIKIRNMRMLYWIDIVIMIMIFYISFLNEY